MEIILKIDDQSGQITVSANGQETPVASLDEAISAIQAIAQEALGGAEQQAAAEGAQPAQPTADDQQAAAEEAAMMQNYIPRKMNSLETKGVL